jgi:septal ring factor EnvC (AmiA/AmiB activator)
MWPLLDGCCRERDAFEAASKLNAMEEMGSSVAQSSLSAELQDLRKACSKAQAELEQRQGELSGLAAEAQQRAEDQAVMAAALSEKASALGRAEQELEVMRAQVEALRGGHTDKENRLRRWGCRQRLVHTRSKAISALEASQLVTSASL